MNKYRGTKLEGGAAQPGAHLTGNRVSSPIFPRILNPSPLCSSVPLCFKTHQQASGEHMAPSGNHQEIRRVWLPVPTGEAGPRFRGPGVVRVRGAVAGSSAAGSVGPVPGDQRRDDDGSRPASDWQRQSTRARPNRAFGRRSEHAQCSPCWPKASFNVARSSAPGRLNHSEVSRHAVKHE